MQKKDKNFVKIFFIIILVIITIFTIIITNRNDYIKNKILNKTITIDTDIINKNNNGKLVLARGFIDYGHDGLTDNLFNINIDAPILYRNVEVYQWEKYEEINKNNKKIYKYKKKWSKEIIDSSKFKNNNYKNPSTKAIENKLFIANNIKFGKFRLSKKQKLKIPCTVKLKINKNMKLNNNFKIYEDFFTNSKNPEKPRIGDIRISYCYNNWKYITILAVQKGYTFDSLKLNDDYRINYINDGVVYLNEIIDSINEEYDNLNK